jgi:hypothetical protein
MANLWVLAVLAKNPARLMLPHPNCCGDCPRDRALSSDYYESSGSVGSNERSSPAHAATPIAAGIVPATGPLSSEYGESLGAGGSNEKSSPAHAVPHPKLQGLSP